MKAKVKIKAGRLKPNQVFFYRGRKCRKLDRKGIFGLADEDKNRLDRKFSLSFHDEVEIIVNENVAVAA